MNIRIFSLTVKQHIVALFLLLMLSTVNAAESAATTIYGTDGNDVISGTPSDEVFDGGIGSDTYIFNLGGGSDILEDSGNTSGIDKLEFGSGIDKEKLWFSMDGTTLRIDVIGSNDVINIPQWQVNNLQIERISTAQDSLNNLEIPDLITAMSAYAPPQGEGAELTEQMKADLFPAISKAWGSPVEIPSITFLNITSDIAAPQLEGAVVTFTLEALGGSGNYEYKLIQNDYHEGINNLLQDWSANNTVVWDTDGHAETNFIKVYARSVGQDVAFYVSEGFYITPKDAIVSFNVTSNIDAPQEEGAVVSFTLEALGGSGNYEYKLIQNDYAKGINNLLQDWSANNIVAWDTEGNSGGNFIKAYARNVGQTGNYYVSKGYSISPKDEIVSLNVTSDVSAPQQEGTAVTFTLEALGGSGNYEYKLIQNDDDDGNYNLLQDWSSNDIVVWETDGHAEANFIQVYARNVGQTDTIYVSDGFYITPKDEILSLNVTSDIVEPQPEGAVVTFTLDAQGGSGSYEYKIIQNDYDEGINNLLQDWSSNNVVSWNTQGHSRSNFIKVYARNVGQAHTAYVSRGFFIYSNQGTADDSDGDGVNNDEDTFPNDATEWADLDSDGKGDNKDPDRDGDGISNDHETQLGFDPNDSTHTPADLDSDAIPDALDTDIDGDGHLNEADVFPTDASEWGDIDADGTGDNADLDRDGDGFDNDVEITAGTDPNDSQSYPDLVAPVITLDSVPSEVQLAQINISGQVVDNSDVQKAWINHISLQNAEFVLTLDQTGGFSELIPLEVGVNTLRVQALDLSGNAAYIDINVTFKSPPVVKGLAPANGGIVVEEENIITGKIETFYDLGDLNLFLDGTLLALTKESDNVYSFETQPLTFAIGDNHFDLLVQTPDGSHKTSLDYQYLPDGSSQLPLPEIQLLFPGEGAILTGESTPYSLIVTSHAGVITTTVNGQKITNPNNQSIMQIKGELALNQQDSKPSITIEATDALGRTTNKKFEFTTDNVAPVITWAAPYINEQTLSVVTTNNRIVGQVIDDNLSSLLINNQSVQMQSTSTPGIYNFYLDAHIASATTETFVAEARDISGNLTNAWITVENNSQINLDWITPENDFKVFTGQGKINIALSGNNIDANYPIIASLIPSNSSGQNQDAIQQAAITKQGNWYVGELLIPTTVTGASGVDDYELQVEVQNATGDIMFVTSRNIQVVDINTETLAIVQKSPQLYDRDIKVDAPIQFTFNQPIDLTKLQVIVKQSVTGQSYVNNDLPQTPYYSQKGDVLQEVFKNKEIVVVNTSILPGDQTAIAYPIERLAFDAKIEVTVLYEQQEIERFRYQTKELPTLSRGRVTDAYGQPLSGIVVSVKSLGISTKTDSEGSYGFGYENGQALSSGVHQLEVNANFEDSRFNNRFVRANVQKGRTNLIDPVALTKLNKKSTFTDLNTSNLSLSVGEVVLDVANATLTMPEGYQEALKAQFVPLSQFTYQSKGYRPDFIYQVTPSGISVEGEIDITIKIPKYLNTYDYLSAVPEGRLAVLLGYNAQENTFGIVGVGQKQGYTVQSVGKSYYQQLDVLGYAFVFDEHHILLEQYVAEKISYLQLIQGLE